MARAPALDISRPVVLLTGFGPFPGMPDNVSARLVQYVSRQARHVHQTHRFHAAVLPTEWHAAPQRLAALIGKLRPAVSLHFGVAKDADGFRIETRGLNSCRMTEDSAGCLPPAPVLIDSGPKSYDVALPVNGIVDRLTALKLPVTTSEDAGGYLCNSIFYHALHARTEPDTLSRAGFIHIPSSLSAPHLTFDAAVTGCLEIIRVVLDDAHPLPR